GPTKQKGKHKEGSADGSGKKKKKKDKGNKEGGKDKKEKADKPIKKEPDDPGDDKRGPGKDGQESDTTPQFLEEEEIITEDCSLPYEWQLTPEFLQKCKAKAQLRRQLNKSYFDPPTQPLRGTVPEAAVGEESPMETSTTTDTGTTDGYLSRDEQEKEDDILFGRLDNQIHGSEVILIYDSYKEGSDLYRYRHNANLFRHKYLHTNLLLSVATNTDITDWIQELEKWTT
ncbi:MAG: hypothetical protein GY740_22535, partial [Gammaproteobacteria bacterium]|nr:hypothetical protein [Gammaproteobacteria bacterium]